MKCSLSVVIPSHNESDNLKRLIPELTKALSVLGDEYEVIVVDNASTDDTKSTLEALTKQFPRVKSVYEPEKGFGRALLRGLREGNGEVLGYIHADNQMSPTEIIRIYQKLVSDNLDVCKATRENSSDGVTRFIISKVYNALFRIMFRVTMKDINGSPKLFTKKFFDTARIESLDWFIDPEIIIKAKRMDAKLGELPIVTFPRKAGVSQVRVATVFEFIRNMLYHWKR